MLTILEPATPLSYVGTTGKSLRLNEIGMAEYPVSIVARLIVKPRKRFWILKSETLPEFPENETI